MEKDDTAEIERMAKEVEERKALEMTEKVALRLAKAKGTIQALTEAGVEVGVTIEVAEDDRRNSLEIGPADCRNKFYYSDLPDLMRQLADYKEAKDEVARLGLLPPPKEPKVKPDKEPRG